MVGLVLLVTDGLPDAQSEEQLSFFGMRLDKIGGKKGSEISPTSVCCHAR